MLDNSIPNTAALASQNPRVIKELAEMRAAWSSCLAFTLCLPGKLMVCERCLGQLPEPDPSYAGEQAKSKGETTHHGLWEQEAPSRLLPLSRLSSLIAVGQ